MRTRTGGSARHRPCAAFTLVEAMIGMTVLGVVIFSLYAGINLGFLSVQGARENLRATQILTEKTEILRLCNWDQLVTPGYLPTNFTANFYEVNGTNVSGPVYTGTLAVSPTGLAVNYSNDLRIVTVTINWETKGIPRTRQLTTLVARYGIQRYVFN